MEKRVIIFGVCGDRCLNIFEYGNSVDYDDLVKDTPIDKKNNVKEAYRKVMHLSLIHI